MKFLIFAKKNCLRDFHVIGIKLGKLLYMRQDRKSVNLEFEDSDEMRKIS